MKHPSKFAQSYRDPRWQKRRLEIMDRDNFSCVDCDDSESTLNVHHAYYVKGREPWEYPPFALSTLCEDCHKRRHEIANEEQRWETFCDIIFNDAILDIVDSVRCDLGLSGDDLSQLVYSAIWDAAQARMGEPFAEKLQAKAQSLQ